MSLILPGFTGGCRRLVSTRRNRGFSILSHYIIRWYYLGVLSQRQVSPSTSERNLCFRLTIEWPSRWLVSGKTLVAQRVEGESGLTWPGMSFQAWCWLTTCGVCLWQHGDYMWLTDIFTLPAIGCCVVLWRDFSTHEFAVGNSVVFLYCKQVRPCPWQVVSSYRWFVGLPLVASAIGCG